MWHITKIATNITHEITLYQQPTLYKLFQQFILHQQPTPYQVNTDRRACPVMGAGVGMPREGRFKPRGILFIHLSPQGEGTTHYKLLLTHPRGGEGGGGYRQPTLYQQPAPPFTHPFLPICTFPFVAIT